MDDAKMNGQDARTGSTAALRSRTPWQTVEGRVISLVSRKGGVGKTTSAVNLGAALALKGHTVLIIGTDPQCGVCRTLGTPPLELRTCLNDVFAAGDGGRNASLNELALTSPLDGLYFVSPRIISLPEEERYLANMEAHGEVLVREVDRARKFYDTILIDCPPSLGPATRAALLASDSYLVPVQAEELCRDSVASLLEFIDAFKDRAYPEPDVSGMQDNDAEFDEMLTAGPDPLALAGIFLTMSSERTRMGRHVAARIGEDFGDLVFNASVPRTTRLAEMALRGKPAVIYDRRSAGSRAYFDLADELVDRYACDEGPDDSLIDAMIESMNRSLGTPDRATRSAQDRPPYEQARNTYDLAQYDEVASPEMVSLEDLLAEEEHRGGAGDDDWEEGYWSGDYRGQGRVN